MFDPSLNPLKLKPSDFRKLFDNYGYTDMNVEFCSLSPKSNPNGNYVAVYSVVFKDDGSFPDDDTREATVYIEFETNGTLVASM